MRRWASFTGVDEETGALMFERADQILVIIDPDILRPGSMRHASAK